SLGGVGSDDLIRDSEAEVELARLGIEGVAGERRGHALDFFDLVNLRDRQDWGRLPVGRPYLHARAEVGDAAIDQRVEILRERPHRGQGQHAGVLSGFGVATADAFYAAIATFGVAALAAAFMAGRRPLAVVGGGILVGFGLRILFDRRRMDEAGAAPIGRGLVWAYASTLGLTITNPATIISFAALAATLGLGTGGSFV